MLLTPCTLAQRILRSGARTRRSGASIPYQVLSPGEVPDRLDDMADYHLAMRPGRICAGI